MNTVTTRWQYYDLMGRNNTRADTESIKSCETFAENIISHLIINGQVVSHQVWMLHYLKPLEFTEDSRHLTMDRLTGSRSLFDFSMAPINTCHYMNFHASTCLSVQVISWEI